MKRRFKIGFYHIFKALGGFHISRQLVKRKLRILGYHGIAVDDLDQFDDFLFIRRETFERRMHLLHKWGMNVIPLQEAVQKLLFDQQPNHSLVITFDDGWFSTVYALPILDIYKFPSTVYITSYYVINNVNVFDVLIRYLFWKSKISQIHLEAIHSNLSGKCDLSRADQRKNICDHLIGFGNTQSISTKIEIAANVAKQLGVELDLINSKRMFQLMTIEELSKLEEHRMNFELHSHRHVLPQHMQGVAQELLENRKVLSQVRAGNYEHFCYPSGKFADFQIPYLQSLEIKSAATSDNNLNSSKTSPYKLARFLDREKHSDVEFEAEICGAAHFVRQFLRCFNFSGKNITTKMKIWVQILAFLTESSYFFILF